MEFFTELFYSLSCLRIFYTASYDYQRFFTLSDHFCNIFQLFFHCHRSRDPMYSLLKEIFREIKGFSLHILRKCDTAGSCLCRIGKHTHRIDQSRHDLFWTGHSVPIFAHRFKSIIRRNCQAGAYFQLLQHWIWLTGCKSVCRKYQKRNIIYGSCRTCSNHIGSSRSHRGRTRNNALSSVLLRISNSGMAHPLLISSLHNSQLPRICIQRFP